MTLKKDRARLYLATVGVVFLTACSNISSSNKFIGLKVKVLVGSALGEFCIRAAEQFNATVPKLDNGTNYRIECQAEGSGDIVSEMVALATQFKEGTLKADEEKFPTLISVDGEIYQSQLIYQINQLFAGQNYLPELTESPLLAYSPLVFMVPSSLESGLRKIPEPYKALTTAKTFRDLDPALEPMPIKYVHTAPTRSNSGLQTLVAQLGSISGKRPEQLTVADVQKYQPQIQQIQSKITRYGVSTDSLAKTMVKNGLFWASVASVYESSVIAANSEVASGAMAIAPKWG
jgi:Ca-activated chloride channel homolog